MVVYLVNYLCIYMAIDRILFDWIIVPCVIEICKHKAHFSQHNFIKQIFYKTVSNEHLKLISRQFINYYYLKKHLIQEYFISFKNG